MIRDYLAPLITMTLGVLLLSGTMLSHDISWYLISTQWWLNGLPIYEKIFELNPPLAYYLTAIPVWISGVLGLHSIAVYKAFVLVLIASSLLMTSALLQISSTIPALFRRTILAVSAIGLVLLPIGDFGQRDHLFTIFFLPFLVMSILDPPPSRAIRTTVSTWAVLGVALKHYFLLLPLIILVYKIFSARSIRPLGNVEYALPTALLIFYIAFSYILHPAYFESVIPRTLQVYGAFDLPFSVMIARSSILIALLTVALFLLALTPGRTHSTKILVLVGAGAVTIFLIQSKGWDYQRIPANFYVMLAVTWAAANLTLARNHWWPMVPATLTLACLVLPAIVSGPYSNTFATRAAQFFTCPPDQRSFQIFSSTVSSGFPLANLANAEPANRAPTLWLFPGAVHLMNQTEDTAEKTKYRNLLNEARKMVLDDFFRSQPHVVIVDISSDKAYFNGASFDYLEYFQQVEEFSTAWTNYRFQGNVGNYEFYSRSECEPPVLLSQKETGIVNPIHSTGLHHSARPILNIL